MRREPRYLTLEDEQAMIRHWRAERARWAFAKEEKKAKKKEEAEDDDE